jgi:hypothetical protein
VSAHIDGPICMFDCPRGIGTSQGKCTADVLPQPGATWKNQGTSDKPTLDPSFNCVGGCGWHGYLVDGQPIDMPVIAGALGTVSSIRVCPSCGDPTIIVIGLVPHPEGIGMTVVILEPRKDLAAVAAAPPV